MGEYGPDERDIEAAMWEPCPHCGYQDCRCSDEEAEEQNATLTVAIEADLRNQVWSLENPTLLTSQTLSRLHDRGWLLVSAFYDPRSISTPYVYILRREAVSP